MPAWVRNREFLAFEPEFIPLGVAFFSFWREDIWLVIRERCVFSGIFVFPLSSFCFSLPSVYNVMRMKSHLIPNLPEWHVGSEGNTTLSKIIFV